MIKQSFRYAMRFSFSSFFPRVSIFFSCYFFFPSAFSLFFSHFTHLLFQRYNTSWQHHEGTISRSIPCHCLFLLSNNVRKKFLEVALGRKRRGLWHDNAIIWKDCLKSGTQENHDDFCETTTQSGNDLLLLKKRISALKLHELSCVIGFYQGLTRGWRNEDGLFVAFFKGLLFIAVCRICWIIFLSLARRKHMNIISGKR